MNIQDRIKEMDEYGFTQEEIAKELNIQLVMVKSALLTDKVSILDKKAQSMERIYKKQIVRHWTRDTEMVHYELLYKHGYLKLNKMIKKYDITGTAEVLGVDKLPLYTLKVHFGYHVPIPPDWEDRITYWNNSKRIAINERDSMICIRCDKQLDTDTVRYHKITHPGTMDISNCATMCNYCRRRMVQHKKTNYKVHIGMDHEQLKAWIKENDAFVHRNRIYKKKNG